jgi:hypothetical protein
LKCDGTRAKTRFRLSAKRTTPFKSAGASDQSTTGSRGVRIGGSNARYNIFRGSLKGTGYLRLSPVSPSLPLPCVTARHPISTGLYKSTKLLLMSPATLQPIRLACCLPTTAVCLAQQIGVFFFKLTVWPDTDCSLRRIRVLSQWTKRI